jgi:hypothetical protein
MAGFGNWATHAVPTMDLARGNVAVHRMTTADGRIADERWERYDGPVDQPQSRLLSTETILFDAAGNQRQTTQERWQHPDGPRARPDQPHLQSSHTTVYDDVGRPVSTTDVQPHISAGDLRFHLTAPTGELIPSAEDVQVPNSWQHRTFDLRGRETSLTTWDDRLGTGSEVLHRYENDGGVLTASFTLAHHQHGHPVDRREEPEPRFLPPGAYIFLYEGFISTESSTQDYRGPDNYHIHTTSDGRTRAVEIDTADRTTHRSIIVDARSDRLVHAEVTTTRPDHSTVRDTFNADGSGERTVTSPKGAVAHIAFDRHGNAASSQPGLPPAVTPQDIQERQATFRSLQSPENSGHDPHFLPEDPYVRHDSPGVLVRSHDIAEAGREAQQRQPPNEPEGSEFATATTFDPASYSPPTDTASAMHRGNGPAVDSGDDDSDDDYGFG